MAGLQEVQRTVYVTYIDCIKLMSMQILQLGCAIKDDPSQSLQLPSGCNNAGTIMVY